MASLLFSFHWLVSERSRSHRYTHCKVKMDEPGCPTGHAPWSHPGCLAPWSCLAPLRRPAPTPLTPACLSPSPRGGQAPACWQVPLQRGGRARSCLQAGAFPKLGQFGGDRDRPPASSPAQQALSLCGRDGWGRTGGRREKQPLQVQAGEHRQGSPDSQTRHPASSCGSRQGIPQSRGCSTESSAWPRPPGWARSPRGAKSRVSVHQLLPEPLVMPPPAQTTGRADPEPL